jgi:hypothetical protein
VASTKDRTFAILLGLCAAAYQLAVVHHFAVSVPFWDEWDGLVGFVADDRAGTLTWARWVAPHMEHRIVVSRAIFLGVGRLFGEANLLACLALSACLMGAIVAVWTYTLRRLHAPLWVVGASAVVLLSPAQFENMLMAFQPPFYVLILATLGAISALALADTVSWRVVIGVTLAAIVSSLSLASGLFAWPILGSLLALRLWFAGRPSRWQLAFFLAAGMLSSAAYLANYHPPAHEAPAGVAAMLRWAGFASTFPILNPTNERAAAWLPLVLVLVTAPIGAALVLYLRRRDRPRLILILGLVLLVAMNVAAMALARSSVVWVASRYGTVLLWASAISLVASADVWRALEGRRRAWRWGLAAGVIVLMCGHTYRYSTYLDEMREVRRVRVAFRENVMSYLADSDPNRQMSDFVPFRKDVLTTMLSDHVFMRVVPYDLWPRGRQAIHGRALAAFVKLADLWLVLVLAVSGLWTWRNRRLLAG